MPQRRPELRRGRIVWAMLCDRNNNRKLRPVIVITATADIHPDKSLEVMAITTTFADPPPQDCVLLPWHPRGNVMTKLRRRSAAVVEWVDSIRVEDVSSCEGDVPPALMDAIMKRVKPV